ncbi:MAG: EAL domain-containing protein [Nitrospirales bacterium]
MSQALKRKIQVLQRQLSQLEQQLGGFSLSDTQRVADVVAEVTAALQRVGAKRQPTGRKAKDPSRSQQGAGSATGFSRNGLELVPDGQFVTDREGCIQLANSTAARLVHVPQGRLVGASLPHFVAKKDQQALLDNLLELDRGEGGREWEMVLHPTGKRSFPALFTASALRDPDGQVVAIHWLVRDLTDQKRAGAADELLQHLGEKLLEGLTLHQILPLMCDRLVEVFGYPLVWIGIKETDGAVTVGARAGIQAVLGDGVQPALGSEGRSPVDQAIATKTTQLLRVDDPRWSVWAEQVKPFGFQSSLVLPLYTREKVLGVLVVCAVRVDAFDSGVMGWFEKLVSQATLSLLMAQDQDNLRLRGAAIASAEQAVFITDPEGRIEWVNDAYTRLTGFSAAETIGQVPQFLKSGRIRTAMKQARRSQSRGQFWCHELVEQRKDGSSYVIEQILTPLRNDEGQVTHFVAIHQDITIRKETEARIFHLAHHDPLTGLPNRVMFNDRLAQALAQARRRGTSVGIVFLDLDQFKPINDSIGHEMGDELLKTVANRLTRCVRATDTVARLSGDEFTLILQDLERGQDAGHVAQKVLEAVARPIPLAGRSVLTTASLGISLFPFDAKDPEVLITQADRGMYRAKEKGGNCYQFFSDEMNAQAFERLMLEKTLLNAWDREEFLLHFQPEVNMRSGQLIGLEALVRWQHPELGLVFPAQFMPMAEEIRFIAPIQEWILRKACHQGIAWKKEGLQIGSIAVNLSIGQAETRKVVGMIERVLTETGLSPNDLKIEISQLAVLNNQKSMISLFQRLKSLGIHIVLDDFCIGDSLPFILERLPIHSLKLSSSLVFNLPMDQESVALVQASLALGREFKLPVVAKGVESAAQVTFLREQGCYGMQGYLCSRPLPAEEITTLLKGWWASEF